MHLFRECKLHSEKQCNGDYYFDDDKSEWIGYTHAPEYKHENDNAPAKEGKAREKDIIKKILSLTGTKEIPSFMGYSGDPRGFVIKIFSDKLTPAEKELCEKYQLMRDWGDDYTIVKDGEI